MAIPGFKRDLAAISRHGFGCVFHQIEENLDQLILVAMDKRQGRIKHGIEGDVTPETVLCNLFDTIEHLVNVHRAAFGQSLIGKRLHPIDQSNNPVRFLADQLRKFAWTHHRLRLPAIGPRRECPRAGFSLRAPASTP